MWGRRIQLHPLHVDILLSQHLFLFHYLGTLVENQWTVDVMVCFRILTSIPPSYVVIVMPVLYSLDYCNSPISFEIRKYESFHFTLFWGCFGLLFLIPSENHRLLKDWVPCSKLWNCLEGALNPLPNQISAFSSHRSLTTCLWVLALVLPWALWLWAGSSLHLRCFIYKWETHTRWHHLSSQELRFFGPVTWRYHPIWGKYHWVQ